MNIIPLLIDFLSWLSGPAGYVLAAAISGVVGAGVTIFAPDRAKVEALYYSKLIWNKAFRRNVSVKSNISRSYEVDDPCDLEVLSDELWEIFGVKPTGMQDRFSFTREKKGVEYEVDVRLITADSGSGRAAIAGMGGMENQGGANQQVVEHVRISVETDIPRRKLRDLLVRGYDLLRNVESEIPTNLEGDTYAINCETGQPPTASHLIGVLGFQEFTASTESGLQLECDDNGVKIRNHGESEVDEALNRTEKLVTLFG